MNKALTVVEGNAHGRASGLASGGLGVETCPSPVRGKLRNMWTKVSRSVWMPVAGKLIAISLGMLGLAGIGVMSERAGAGVGYAPAPADAHAAGVGLTWLRPVTNPQHAPSASASAAARSGSSSRVPIDKPRPHERVETDGEKKDHAPAQSGITADGLVILNEANAAEFTRLPGVGQKRALAIVKLRERLKRFRRKSDLLRVRGIGVKSLRKLLPLVIVDRPPPPAPAPKSEQDAGPAPAQ